MYLTIDDVLSEPLSWLYSVLMVIEGKVYQVCYDDDDDVAFLSLPQFEGS